MIFFAFATAAAIVAAIDPDRHTHIALHTWEYRERYRLFPCIDHSDRFEYVCVCVFDILLITVLIFINLLEYIIFIISDHNERFLFSLSD